MTYYSGMYKDMQKKSKQLKITPFSTLPSQMPVILPCLVAMTAFSQKHRHHLGNTITSAFMFINY
jgi:hypothetical protein